MKILPYPIDHFFRPAAETAQRSEETDRAKPRKGADPMQGDWVEISAQGRKDQIQREMVAEIIRRIR